MYMLRFKLEPSKAYSILILLAILLAFAGLAYFKESYAGPATPTNYYTLCIGTSDCFKNWDSNSDSIFNPSTADWPVTIIYYGNAEVDKIKIAYSWLLTGFGNSMYMLMTDDGKTWFVDSDRGMKDVFIFLPPLKLCGYTIDIAYAHVRLYANPDRDYNVHPDLGRYVIATSHLDEWPFESWSGFASVGEEVAITAALNLGWTVYPNYAYGYNSDYCRIVGSHINNNDGWISYIRVP
jgi:uncharacterized protein (UPF0333 family)